MRRLLFWLAMGPIGLLVILFSVSNRDAVTAAFWPLPFELQVPLYAVGLGGLALGFLWGAVVAWFTGGRTRQRAREAVGERDMMARKVRRLEERVSSGDQAEKSSAETAGTVGSTALVSRPPAA